MRLPLIFLTVVLTATFSFAQKIINLEQAVQIALQKNTTVRKAVNNIAAYESGVKSAFGNLLPSMNASGSFSWSRSEDKGGSVNFGGGIVINTPASTTESRYYRADVSTSWTLFDGLSNFANLSQSQNDLQSAKFSLERLKQDITFQTINYYYDIINAQQLLNVKEDDLKWNQKNLETIIERNKLGSVTIADVYAQQVKTGTAELELIRAKNSLETAKTNMLYFLGLDVLQEYMFEDTQLMEQLKAGGDKLKIQYDNLSDLVKTALAKRPDYTGKKFNVESAYDGLSIARAGHYPRLTNSLSYNLRSNTFDEILDSRTYSVGLTLSIPIFQGWSVEERVQAAEVNIKNKEIELTDLEREIKLNLQKNYLDLQASEKRLDVSRKNVQASEQNRKIEEEKYALGSGTLLNVLIANSDYTSALTNYINSQFEFAKLNEQLKYYLGMLDSNKIE